MKPPRQLARDTSGASIVIALVFFLICGIVGSVVVTAASVQAKSVQTHKELQQDEYAMQSAAELVADQLGGSEEIEETVNGTVNTVRKNAVTIGVSYNGEAPVADVSQVRTQLGKSFWSKERTESILVQSADYIIGKPGASSIEIKPPQGTRPVYATLVVDTDLNITVNMSLDKSFSAASPYNMGYHPRTPPTTSTESWHSSPRRQHGHRESDEWGSAIRRAREVAHAKLTSA